jgi:hypothetical protein
VDRCAAAEAVDHPTWDAGREGTFWRVACMDVRVEGQCTVRNSLHLRIFTAACTAVVAMDTGQVAGTYAGNTLVASAVGEYRFSLTWNSVRAPTRKDTSLGSTLSSNVTVQTR